MKKYSLTLLLACGMFVSATAQHEISKKNNSEASEKWVITPVPNMKGVLGMLDINFPADVERNILIYQQADNKFLRSVSRNDKTYPITPGQYRFTLTNVPVENVPIQKGHETRLNAGFLDIVSEGHWDLYDETKEKAYTSGNKPKKLPLPVGRYQIKLGGQFYPVIIKDGETVEDYSPVEVKDMTPVEIKDSELPISDNISETFFSIDAEQYTMTRVPTGGEDTAMQTKGRLATKFPLATRDAFLGIKSQLYIFSADRENLIYQCSNGNIPYCPSSYNLDEGTYVVEFRVHSLNLGGGYGLPVPNVAIRKGFETQLKVGYLVHSARGLYQIYRNAANQSPFMRYSSQGQARLALPIGNYWVRLCFVGGFPVEIKEGEVSVVKPPDIGIKSISKTIISTTKQKLKFRFGRLNTFFPEDTSLKISVRVPTPNSTGYTYISLDTVRTYDLLAGNYQVYLNRMLIEVPIQEGKETRIRFGYLDIQVLESLSIYNVETGLHTSSNGLRKIALPIGYYNIRIDASSYLVKIDEGKTMVFTFQ